MELRHLRTFVAVAETLNISEAARRLRVTQPALSRQIRALEDTLGRPLFVRVPGRLRLTSAGVTLHEHGMKALAAVEDAVRSVRVGDSPEEATLRVGYYGTMSVWAGILAPALEKAGRRYPNLCFHMVELTCAGLAQRFREGELDVALLGPGDYGQIPGVDIAVACAAPALAMVAANHRLAKRRLIAVEDLRDEEIIGATPESAPGRDRAVIEACQVAGFTPRVSLVATSLPELIMSVKKRMGVGIVGSLATIAPHPGVVFIKFKPPGILLELYSAHALSAPPAAQHLAELIREEAQRVARA